MGGQDGKAGRQTDSPAVQPFVQASACARRGCTRAAQYMASFRGTAQRAGRFAITNALTSDELGWAGLGRAKRGRAGRGRA